MRRLGTLGWCSGGTKNCLVSIQNTFEQSILKQKDEVAFHGPNHVINYHNEPLIVEIYSKMLLRHLICCNGLCSAGICMNCKWGFSATFFCPFCCTRSPICFNGAEGEKVSRHHICLNSQMFKHMSSLATLNSIYSLIELCLIGVVDIPLESPDSYQHFYFNSLILTRSAETPHTRNPPVRLGKVWRKRLG